MGFEQLSDYQVLNNDSAVLNERPRLKWEGNIKVDIEGPGCECGFWTELAKVMVK